MKASELIEKLQNYVDELGELPVRLVPHGAAMKVVFVDDEAFENQPPATYVCLEDVDFGEVYVVPSDADLSNHPYFKDTVVDDTRRKAAKGR